MPWGGMGRGTSVQLSVPGTLPAPGLRQLLFYFLHPWVYVFWTFYVKHHHRYVTCKHVRCRLQGCSDWVCLGCPLADVTYALVI